MFSRIVLYVIGELQTRSNTGDPEVDALHNEHFYSWCGDDLDDDGLHRCDFTGRHRLLKMIQMAFLAMLVDGDHGFVMVREGIGELQLQQIEGDRIGSPLEMQITEDYIFVANGDYGQSNGTVTEYDATTGGAPTLTISSGLNYPGALAFFGSDIFVANEQANTVTEYDATAGGSPLLTISDGVSEPTALTLSGNNLFVENFASGTVTEYNATTGGAPILTISTGLPDLYSMVLSSPGHPACA